MSDIPNTSQKKNNNKNIYTVIICLLTAVAVVPLLAPTLVAVCSSFTQTDGTAENIFYIFRGILAVALVIGTVTFTVNKKKYALAIPSFIAFVTCLFPLFENVTLMTDAIQTVHKLNMTIDYTLYIVNIGLYLLLTLLGLFNGLFASGILKSDFIVLFLSVITSLATILLAVDKHLTLQMPVYEILTFVCASPIALIPTFLVMSSDKTAPKKKKTKARRYRK